MKIKNIVKIPATGKEGNKFVGIRINENKIEFHYPETFNLSENDDELRKDILSILRTISLAKTTTSDSSTYNTKFKNDNVFPINSYLWIINDYLTYGRYENREKIYDKNINGKINWKKTLHTNPAISKSNIVYTDIIHEKRNQKDNILTEIYNCCVNQAVTNVGWLYGITYDCDGVDYNSLYTKRNKYYVNVLNTELSHTFDDKKKIRLQNMKNIITGLDDEMVNTKEIIYGVDSYEYVYERMVDKFFSNIDNIKDFYPNAIWKLKSGIENNSSNLRPDTIMIKNNVVYILDSKYYRYGTTFSMSDLPNTDSIQKQITYGEYINQAKKGQYDDVFSAFIMPYSKTNNINHYEFNKDIEFIGLANAKWYDSNEPNDRKVAGILIDMNFLISNWIRRNEDSMNNLINIIENNIKEARV